jgi:hypothetical protein
MNSHERQDHMNVMQRNHLIAELRQNITTVNTNLVFAAEHVEQLDDDSLEQAHGATCEFLSASREMRKGFEAPEQKAG